MHFIFIPYGNRNEVELLLRDMESQKYPFILKKGNETKSIHVAGGIRLLPFGIYEYIAPKESADVILNTLIEGEPNRYLLNSFTTTFLRKIIKAEKIPNYEEKFKYPWTKANVNVIVLGVRYDLEMIEDSGEYIGWTHEAL